MLNISGISEGFVLDQYSGRHESENLSRPWIG